MANASIVIPQPRPVHISLAGAWQWFLRRILLGFSLGILSLLLITAVFAPWIAPFDGKGIGAKLDEKNTPPFWMDTIIVQKTVVEGFPEEQETKISLSRARNLAVADRILDSSGKPLTREQVEAGLGIQQVIRPTGTTKHLLGTDQLGRDLLSRIIWGARISLVVAGVTLLVGGVVGTGLGLISGYYGGWVDEIILRLVDIALALPIVLVALVMVVTLGTLEIPLLPQKEVHLIASVLSLFIWVRFARQVRGEVLQLKKLDYIDLARVAGCSTKRILITHLLPGVLNTVIVISTLQVSTVILLESTLSFLGAGVPPPTPAWGSMVSEGRDILKDAWWVSTMPGIALLFTVMAFNLLGDWIRDALDPRLRQQE